MNKKIVLWEIKRERLNKMIEIRKRKNNIYKIETREDFRKFSFLFKKFIVNSIGLFGFLGKLVFSLTKLFVWYLIIVSLKIDKILFIKK